MVLVLPKPQLHSFVCWPLLRAPSQQRTLGSDADKVASLGMVVLEKVCLLVEHISACKYDIFIYLFL